MKNIDLIVLTVGFSSCKKFEKEVRRNFKKSFKEMVLIKYKYKKITIITYAIAMTFITNN